MRIILRNQGNGLYLAENGQWTGHKEEAKDFDSVTEAEHYCQEHEMDAIALALKGGLVYPIQLDCQSKKQRRRIKQHH